jgi:hypothetical protein
MEVEIPKAISSNIQTANEKQVFKVTEVSVSFINNFLTVSSHISLKEFRFLNGREFASFERTKAGRKSLKIRRRMMDGGEK